ncbi:MAG: hypothetical protein ACI9XK_005208, partial [Granulosicoccus sp.]
MMLQHLSPFAFCSPRVNLSLPTYHVCVKWLTSASIVAVLTGCQSAIGRADLQEPLVSLSVAESYTSKQINWSVAPSGSRQKIQ